MEEDKVEKTIERKVVFISGNTDLTEKNFLNYYAHPLAELANDDSYYFNISDEDGCAAMLQSLFNRLVKNKDRVNVFYLGEFPKNLISKEFVTIGGFRTLEERNAGMTMASNMDFHIILSGKGRSAVEANICRRNTPEYDYMKHWVMGNQSFWNLFHKQKK